VRQVGYYQEFITRCTVNKIQNKKIVPEHVAGDFVQLLCLCSACKIGFICQLRTISTVL